MLAAAAAANVACSHKRRSPPAAQRAGQAGAAVLSEGDDPDCQA